MKILQGIKISLHSVPNFLISPCLPTIETNILLSLVALYLSFIKSLVILITLSEKLVKSLHILEYLIHSTDYFQSVDIAQYRN